jgi:hypothetical protein
LKDNETHKTQAGGISRFLPWAMLIFVGGLLLLFGAHGYPVPDGDAAYYWPPMLSRAQGAALTNDFSHLIRQFDSSGQHRLVFHGYLYPLLVGLLVWSPDYAAINMLISIIMVASLALGTLLFIRVAGGMRTLTLLDSAIVATAIPAFATLILGLSDRAETLGLPIISLGCLLFLSCSRRWNGVIFGSAIGVLAATHPMGGILASLIVGIATFSRMRAIEAFRSLSVAGLTSLAVWGVTFSVYPYPIRDWIGGLMSNGRNVVPSSLGMNADILYRWFVQTRSTGYAFVFIIGFGILIFQAKRHWRAVPGKLGVTACAIPLLGAIFNYGIRGPGQNYNLLLFSPLLIALIIWQFSRMQPTAATFGRWMKIGVIGTFGIASTGFVRTAMIFPYFLNSCLSRKSGQKQLAVIQAKYPGSIGLTSGLFTLTTTYAGIDEVELGLPKNGEWRLVRSVDVPWNYVELGSAGQDTLLIQQVYKGFDQPPVIAGYRMVENGFTVSRPSLAGIKLGGKFSGYNFAVYRKESVGTAP